MVIVVFCAIKATGRKLLFSSYTTGLGFFKAKKAIFLPNERRFCNCISVERLRVFSQSVTIPLNILVIVRLLATFLTLFTSVNYKAC